LPRTARRPEQLADLIAEFGDRVLPLALDVTDAGAATSTLAAARERFGRLDVIVNNAGYANVSSIETADDSDFRAQFETNFWGVYHLSKAAIPLLRQQGGGLMMQISSIGGRVGGTPGIASYQAAKFRDRRLQPRPARRDSALRHQSAGGRAQRLPHRLGRHIDDPCTRYRTDTRRRSGAWRGVVSSARPPATRCAPPRSW